MFDLEGRVMLVTGATGNLGRAAARRLGAAGAVTVLVDRNRQRLEETFGEHRDSARTLLVGGVDLTDPASADRMIASALDTLGRLDGVFNTVGGFAGGKPVHEEDLETWERMFELNVRTSVVIARAAAPPMLRRGHGAIVNTAGRPALSGPAGLAAYAAAKSAVLRLSEALAEELKARGVRVNCVVPGIIDTPQNRQSMPDADRDAWVEPDAVADVAAFLLSDAARGVTGAAVPVYGKG